MTALSTAEQVLARDLTHPLWPGLTESDWARDAQELAREVLRLRDALEHIAGLPDISGSSRRRADYLAREALRASHSQKEPT